MAELDRRYGASNPATTGADYDAGLRTFMLGVYNYMAIGVALTGAAAYGLFTYAMASPEVAQLVFGSPLKWVLFFAPLGVVFYLSARMHTMSEATARTWFYVYAVLVGLMLSSIFVVYTHQSIAQVFFISAAMFAGMSLWGYTTKTSLTGFGSFLMMGLIGLIIAMLVNLFFQLPALSFAISAIGVVIFAGLTAYDTQKLKEVYLTSAGTGAELGNSAVRGALSLYLDFLNVFLFLLQLLGGRRE